MEVDKDDEEDKEDKQRQGETSSILTVVTWSLGGILSDPTLH